MATRIFSTLRGSSWVLGLLGVVGASGATGCFLSKGEEVSSSPDEVVSGAQPSLLLKSTLVLDAGCIATKVGPRHLLLSARCVSGNEAFAKGKVLGFKTANNATPTKAEDTVLAPADAGNGRGRDAGSTSTADAGTAGDAGAKKTDAGATTKPASSREATIAEVNVHPSWESKCAGDACKLGSVDASDAPDIALVILESDLEGIASVPVDLDPVGQADPLLVLGSDCEIVGADEGKGLTSKKTIAVPPKSVNHKGSAFETEPQKVGTLQASYFVTAGSAWRKTELWLCRSDLGAPVFRAGVGAVAGITSSFTTWTPDSWVPVTIEHTRLDPMSRYKIGNWLESQGVETLHSCSEMPGGCQKRDYDGGAPVPPSAGPTGGTTTDPGEDDAGRGDAMAPSGDGGAKEEEDAGPVNPSPSGGQEEPLADQGPPEDDYAGGEDEGADYADAAAPRKKKKTQEGGCSAAPGPMPAGEMGLVMGVGLAVMAIGRRRRNG